MSENPNYYVYTRRDRMKAMAALEKAKKLGKPAVFLPKGVNGEMLMERTNARRAFNADPNRSKEIARYAGGERKRCGC